VFVPIHRSAALIVAWRWRRILTCPHINRVTEYPATLPCSEPDSGLDAVCARTRDGVSKLGAVLRLCDRFTMPNHAQITRLRRVRLQDQAIAERDFPAHDCAMRPIVPDETEAARRVDLVVAREAAPLPQGGINDGLIRSHIPAKFPIAEYMRIYCTVEEFIREDGPREWAHRIRCPMSIGVAYCNYALPSRK